MTAFEISTILTALISFAMSVFVILIKPRVKINKLFFSVCLFLSIWSFGLFKVVSASSEIQAIFWLKILYIGAIFIPIAFYHFISNFLNNEKRRVILTGYLVSIAFLFFDFFSKLFIAGAPPLTGFRFWVKGGPIYYVFALYFFTLMMIIFYDLFFRKNKLTVIQEKQLKFIKLGAIFGFLGGATNFFPQFFNIYPVGNYLVILYVYFIGYSILKHKLFNIKVVATQILTFAIWIVFILEIVFADTLRQRLTQGAVLIILVIFGYLLIRSVQKEVESREEKEKMATELLLANIHLKELDKAKSDFISIASHQLRSPVTAIKGYSSMILEGSYGTITQKLKDPIEKIFESSRRLVLTIGDFLDVSKIESGNMQYDFVKFDIKEMLKSLTDEFRNTLTTSGASARDNRASKIKKDIEFKLEIVDEKEYSVEADQNKIRQVLSNLIDNAIKYTQKGCVAVSLQKDMGGKTVLIKIKDSGIGMTEATMDKLFQKFIRAEGVSKMHTDGSGLGLFVGREVIRAHGGSIWAESEGEGKGSTFCVRLPVNKIVSDIRPAPVNILSNLGYVSPSTTNTSGNFKTDGVDDFMKKL